MSNPWDISLQQQTYLINNKVNLSTNYKKTIKDFYCKQKKIFDLSNSLSNLFISIETKQEQRKFISLLSNSQEERLLTLIQNLKINICSLTSALSHNIFTKGSVVDTFVLPYEFIDMFIEVITDIFNIIKSLPSLLEVNNINIKLISQRINNKFS